MTASATTVVGYIEVPTFVQEISERRAKVREPRQLPPPPIELTQTGWTCLVEKLKRQHAAVPEVARKAALQVIQLFN